MATDQSWMSGEATNDPTWDVFISHAREDKDEVARPLAERLEASGVKVWFDEHTLSLGDSLQQKIDEGLAQSRYGVVIFSPSFFKKRWPRKELDGLAAREEIENKVILPVWHDLSVEEVTRASPTLAGRLAASTSMGIEYVVEEILHVIKPQTEPSPLPTIEDIFNRDPVVSFAAVARLASERHVDLQAVVDELQGLNHVSVLSARSFLAQYPQETASLMTEKILNAHSDWHAATQVPDCFDVAHAPYCVGRLAEAAMTTGEPDVARKAIESLGFLGASRRAFDILELLKASDTYWYYKIEYYVVLALARILCVQVDKDGWYQAFKDDLRYTFNLLEEAVQLAADSGWRSALYGDLQTVLSGCPSDRADFFLNGWINADHVDLRKLGARALGEMRLSRAVPHLAQLLQNTGEDEEVRHEAALAIGNVGGPQAVRLLYDVSTQSDNPGVASKARAALARCLHEVTDPDELQSLADELVKSDLKTQLWVYRAMGLAGDARFVVPLREALTDINPTVRAQAALALARLSGDAEFERLKTANAEAGSPMERVVTGLAVLRAQGSTVSENQLAKLRDDLKAESYFYDRLTQEDIIAELRNCGHETAKFIADSWERVYATTPDY